MTEHEHNGQLPPISGPGANESPGRSDAIPQVEGYQITDPLGHGGMGTVWSAVQLSTRRQVALKLLGKGAFASGKAQARFEREVELTARLQHPNIAQIFDSGLHEGVPYYAMELIGGVPLDRYVEGQGLTQRQILELMRTICQAVEHAHQSGVIHRDLKPSNILVTPDGQPHVLDFGLAKGLLEGDSKLTISADGEATGTPAYMSPEQAAGHIEQIDTRTDVYSLGVIFFGLLTKESPHDISGTRYEVLRRIAEDEVRRPRDITKEVDRELEAVLLKALAHDPKDRYSYAGALAHDIENYLTDEPLSARPPTTAYFLRKRIWKHRVPVAIACAVLAVLVGMAVVAYLRVVQERTRAVSAESLARERLAETERARDGLQREADKAKAVSQFLRSIIISPHPGGPRISSPPALDKAVRDVGITYADQPEVEAAVRTEIGNAFGALNQLEAAEEQFSRAEEIRRLVLGEEHPDTLSSMEILAVTRSQTGKLDAAEPLQKQVLKVRRRILGEEHPDTLKSMDDLRLTLLKRGSLDEMEALEREILKVRHRILGETHSATLSAMGSLARVLRRRRKLDEAEGLLRQTLQVLRRDQGKEDWATLSARSRLALVVEERGNLSEAEVLRKESLEIQQRYGEKRLDTLKAMNELASTLWRAGKLNEAESVNRRILEIREAVHGDEHLDTLWAMDNLVFLLKERGTTDEAEALRKKSREIRHRIFGRDRADSQPASPPVTAPTEVESNTVAARPGEGKVLAYDGFDGKLSLGWDILKPDPSHFSLSRHQGTLTITTQEGAFSALKADYENLFLIDRPAPLWEDFQLTTCMSSFKPIAHWNQAGLICYNDDDDYLKFVYQWTTMPAGRVFTVGIETEGSFSFIHFLPRQEAERVWLRVTKRGCRYTFSTSFDGRTFLPTGCPEHDRTGLFQGGVVWGNGRVKQVGLFAKNGPDTRAPEIDASFDFFEVRSVGAPPGAPEEEASDRNREMNLENER